MCLTCNGVQPDKFLNALTVSPIQNNICQLSSLNFHTFLTEKVKITGEGYKTKMIQIPITLDVIASGNSKGSIFLSASATILKEHSQAVYIRTRS